MSFTSKDEIKLDYLFRSILRDIALMELFNVDKETKDVFTEWKKKYGKDIKNINLLDLVQHVGKLFRIVDNFKYNFLNHYYHRHFLYDIEYFRYFLESKGSKTGDINSVMMRSCNNKDYITNIPKDTYYMNILISTCHIIIHSSYNMPIDLYKYILDIISNLKKTKNVHKQIESISLVVEKINSSPFPLPSIIYDTVTHVTQFCLNMLPNDENQKKESNKTEREKKLEDLSESYQFNNDSLKPSFPPSSNYPKSFLIIEDE